MILNSIIGARIIDSIDVKGDINKDIGAYINVPKGKYVYIQNFKARNVFIPFIKFGEGLLEIGNVDLARCGGDAYNCRSSHMHIDNYYARDWLPTRRYNSYHCDIGGQLYAVKSDRSTVDNSGLIEDIHINNFHIESSNPIVQGFMASEACRYKNIRIGTSSINCEIAYPYPIVLNTAEDCIIGNKENKKFTGRVKLANVKNSVWKSSNNVIIV